MEEGNLSYERRDYKEIVGKQQFNTGINKIPSFAISARMGLGDKHAT